MVQFFFGAMTGIILMGLISFEKPFWFSGVQQELVKQGHGFYNPLTREFVLKECK